MTNNGNIYNKNSFDETTVENLKEQHLKTRERILNLTSEGTEKINKLLINFDFLFNFILDGENSLKINEESKILINVIKNIVLGLIDDLKGNNQELKNSFLNIEKIVIEEFIRLGGEIKLDDLTKLGSSGYFRNKLNKYCLEKRNFKLILFDLNDFKTINDAYGHENGDNGLIYFGKGLVRDDTFGDNSSEIFRIGGDEFAIIYFGDIDTLNTKIRLTRKYFFENFFKITKNKKETGELHEITFGVGYDSINYNNENPITKLKESADKKTFHDKKLEKIRSYIKGHKITILILELIEEKLKVFNKNINNIQEMRDILYKETFLYLSSITKIIIKKYYSTEEKLVDKHILESKEHRNGESIEKLKKEKEYDIFIELFNDIDTFLNNDENKKLIIESFDKFFEHLILSNK